MSQEAGITVASAKTMHIKARRKVVMLFAETVDEYVAADATDAQAVDEEPPKAKKPRKATPRKGKTVKKEPELKEEESNGQYEDGGDLPSTQPALEKISEESEAVAWWLDRMASVERES